MAAGCRVVKWPLDMNFTCEVHPKAFGVGLAILTEALEAQKLCIELLDVPFRSRLGIPESRQTHGAEGDFRFAKVRITH